MAKSTGINTGTKTHLRDCSLYIGKAGKRCYKHNDHRETVCKSGHNIKNSIYDVLDFLKLRKDYPEMCCKRCVDTFNKKLKAL